MFRKMLLSNKYSLKLLVWWLDQKDSFYQKIQRLQYWMVLNYTFLTHPILKFLLKLRKPHKPKQTKTFTIEVDSETWEILDKKD